MNKEFITYEQALALKELGFDGPCFAYYNKKELFSFTQICNEPLEGHYIKMSNRLCVPLYQQAFRWFREKYEYISFIRGRKSMGFDYTLSDVPTNLSKRDTFQSPHVYQTYEEAELECLKKLIEIVKNK